MASSGDGNGAPAAKKRRVTKYFGNKELSDVVLHVGNRDLHVHKMTLASNSSYFYQLFFSKGSEEKNTFIIDEAGRSAFHFQCVIRSMYQNCTGRIHLCKSTSSVDNLGSPNGERYQKTFKYLESFWDYHPCDISEKYGLAAQFKGSMDAHFLAEDCRREDCLKCTMKRLAALHYNFPNAETKLDPKSMVFCLRRFGLCRDAFNISTSMLLKIFSRNSPERATKAPETAPPAAEIDGPICLEYGDSLLSDITLVMGKYEFKVHKMSLANRSPYFRAMFFSQFKEKDEERISIEADGYSFKLLLELLYNDNSFEDSDFLECRPGEPLQSAWSRADKFWKVMPEIMKTLEFFNFPTQMVESSLGNHFCRMGYCIECAHKKVFAMVYNLAFLNKKITSIPMAVVSCLINFPECIPKRLSFVPDELAQLIEATINTTTRRIRR